MRLRRRGCERGNTMVEFAIAFSVLFPAFTGVYQFGQAYYQYNNLESAVRAAGRNASLRVYDSTTSTPSTAYRDAVRNMVMTGDPNAPSKTIFPTNPNAKPPINDLKPNQIEVLMAFKDGIPAEVTVRVVNYSLDAFFAKFPLHRKPSVKFPYLGRWDPVP